MTHYESAIHELPERLQGTDARLTTSIADILTAALQELIEVELIARIGAEPDERIPTRPAQRNGHRSSLRRFCDSGPGGWPQDGKNQPSKDPPPRRSSGSADRLTPTSACRRSLMGGCNRMAGPP